MTMTYWQISSGFFGRNYSEYFTKHGIACVGTVEQEEWKTMVNKGDIIVLKRGISGIIAAGEVVERNGKSTGYATADDKDKFWLWDFDGWDLSAYCYVDWHVHPSKDGEPTSGLSRGAIVKLMQPTPQSIANDIISSYPVAKIEPEPRRVGDIKDDKILEHLISEGMRVSSADDLTNTINRIRLLAKYYYHKCNWDEVREHETRSFLVVPLLLALGWSEQQLKIEYPCKGGKVDIACFRNPCNKKTNDGNECTLLVETKGFAQGLDYVWEQIERYQEYFSSCKRALITNGYCYKAYKISPVTTEPEDKPEKLPQGDIEPKVKPPKPPPYAYLNLIDPKDRYPLDPDNVDGALAVLSCLLPGDK
jgi:hypothetical protein